MAGVAPEDVESNEDGPVTFEARWPPDGDDIAEEPLAHSMPRLELNQPLSPLEGQRRVFTFDREIIEQLTNNRLR